MQADAFSGYDCIYAGGTVREVACWAHGRRKFFDALPTNGSACSEALAMIQEMYAVERDCESSTRPTNAADESIPATSSTTPTASTTGDGINLLGVPQEG